MTTSPTARRFRLRGASAGMPAKAPAAPAQPAREEPWPTGQADMLASPAAEDRDRELEKIRAEGLTARQLRMARRVALRHGIEVEDDHLAVLLLRERGIDPFQRTSLIELVRGEADAGATQPVPAEADGGIHLPQTVKGGRNLPAQPLIDEKQRAAEILRIQRDIARRRRRKMAMLAVRLFLFVVLPSVLAGWYYYAVATPLYATKSEFVIQKAEPAAQTGSLGSLFSGTQFATTQDSITVQSYLQSRDAMLRLDRDLGFKAHFADPSVDVIQRLDADASNEEAYKLYQRNVKIGFDPTEGIIRMEVSAADPAVSQRFSEALIGYAEEQVDQLTQRLRADQMQGARDSYEEAEANVQEAQDKVLALQKQLGVLDPRSETAVVMNQVATFEAQLQDKRLELRALLDNARPNEARVQGAEADVARLETLIAELRSQLTTDTADAASLALVTGQLELAQGELQNRRQLLTLALQQMETARIEANRQVRYLSMGVSPVAPDEPTYPRAFENTLVASLIFAGIYLMLSLTASILREQASS